MTRSFTYHGPRIGRTLIALAALLMCPLLLSKFSEHGDLIFVLFGAISSVWLIAVVVTAIRFKLVIEETALTCRGRFTSRNILFSDITAITLRQGRDRAGRFSANTMLRELVIQTDSKMLVLSSIPLGPDSFDEVVSLLKARLPSEIWH